MSPLVCSSVDETLFGTRNQRGEWTPERRAECGPLFDWPIGPRRIGRWLVSSYLFPWNAFYAAVACAVYFLATPVSTTMRSWAPGWVAVILVRNVAIVAVWCGVAHWWLYVRREQETRFKYNARWPRNSDRFLFGGQTRENVFLTLASGVPIATAYECLFHWLFANNHIVWLSWSTNPVWFVAWMALIPLFRELHFYWVHRLIHVPVLYRSVHALHHRNTNPGPWSGLSMHPVEHLLYYSGVLIHAVVSSHPLHATFQLVHLTMSPALGHIGFERVETGPSRAFHTNARAHYLHHKYFEVNYSDGTIPFDRWFGSFHDGSPDAHEAMKQRLATRNVTTT